ncbi:Uncharacterised protein [Klebsiella pneumoniae]|nr:Uncharacterised protein [Klebsiella pneumoniae]
MYLVIKQRPHQPGRLFRVAGLPGLWEQDGHPGLSVTLHAPVFLRFIIGIENENHRLQHGIQHQLRQVIRNTVTVVVILTELLRRVEQLGLIHLWVKILHARLQNQLIHPVRGLVCYLVLASPEHRRLFFITNLFCRLTRGRQRFGILGALIEGRFQHRASGIAVDAPGGDPGHLLSNDGFQTAAGGRWFVVRGCFGIERFRRGLAQSKFAPGVEAVD